MHEANLTRFGPAVYEGQPNQSQTFSATFKATEGDGSLDVQSIGMAEAQVTLNGQSVGPFDPAGETPLRVGLRRENQVEVRLPSGTGSLSLRVRQKAQADIGIVCQGYFGLNTSNMERQRAFYDTLGFPGEIYPAGPETSTSFARSLGFEDDYLIYVSLHSLNDPPTMPFVDTVQFRGDSYRDEPPYANLNHIGMAYATYSTRNLDAAFAYLQARDVAFVTPPAVAPNGERFVFLKDQDGAFLKLIESSEGEGSSEGAQLIRLVNTNMNVTDLERSREFYRLLGFSESAPASQSGAGEFAAAHGFAGPIEFLGEDVSLGEGTDGATLQLRQWQNPFDAAPAYPPPVNHLGIDRINFYVKDLTAAIRTMTELGFEQLGPIGGAPEIGIVFFFDPDGIKVQLAGPQTG